MVPRMTRYPIVAAGIAATRQDYENARRSDEGTVPDLLSGTNAALSKSTNLSGGVIPFKPPRGVAKFL